MTIRRTDEPGSDPAGSEPADDASARVSGEQLRACLDNLVDAIAIYRAVRDEDGEVVDFRVTYANDAACRTTRLSHDALFDSSIREIAPAQADAAVARFCEVLETGEPLVLREADVARALGRPSEHRWYDVELVPAADGVAASWRDVTERVEADAALAASEERYQRQAEELGLIYRTAPIGLCTLDPDHRIQNANDRLAEMNGVPLDVLLGALGPAIDPDMGAQLWPLVDRVFAAGDVVLSVEVSGRVRGPDGPSERHWLCSVAPLRGEDGDVEAASCALQDVTEQKRTTAALARARATLEHEVAERTAALHQRAAQLRGLASQLADVEQRERRRLAEVLHDDVQQGLAAVTMQLQSVRRRADVAGFGDVIGRVVDLVGRALSKTRTLSAELCPPVLYEDGLGPALRWLADQFAVQYDLAVTVSGDVEAAGGDDRVRALLYESVRELLLNVARHARVDRAEVSIETDADGGCSVRVADTGRGFDPAALTEDDRTTGFGLFSVAERLADLGGRLDLDAAPGTGVRVTLHAPARARDD